MEILKYILIVVMQAPNGNPNTIVAVLDSKEACMLAKEINISQLNSKGVKILAQGCYPQYLGK